MAFTSYKGSDVFDLSSEYIGTGQGALEDPNMIALLDILVDDILAGNRPEALNLLGEVETKNQNIRSNVANFPRGTFGEQGPTEVPWNPLEPLTTDSGYYQFTEATAETAKKRALNIGFDPAFVKTLSNDPMKWTQEEQSIMALANLFPRKISSTQKTYSGEQGRGGLVDELLKELFIDFDNSNPDDIKAFKVIYYSLWQTDPSKEGVETNVDRAIKDRQKILTTP